MWPKDDNECYGINLPPPPFPLLTLLPLYAGIHVIVVTIQYMMAYVGWREARQAAAPAKRVMGAVRSGRLGDHVGLHYTTTPWAFLQLSKNDKNSTKLCRNCAAPHHFTGFLARKGAFPGMGPKQGLRLVSPHGSRELCLFDGSPR